VSCFRASRAHRSTHSGWNYRSLGIRARGGRNRAGVRAGAAVIQHRRRLGLVRWRSPLMRTTDWMMGVNRRHCQRHPTVRAAHDRARPRPGTSSHRVDGSFTARDPAGIYSASKFAVRGLTEALRTALANTTSASRSVSRKRQHQHRESAFTPSGAPEEERLPVQ